MTSHATRIHPFISALSLCTAVCLGSAHAALVTDTTTFTAFSVTYDETAWGPILFPREADSFSQTLPVSQYGYGRFYFDPELMASSDGSFGPSHLRITGRITFTTKPGWGLSHIDFDHVGQWTTTGSGGVSVADSFVDVSAPNTQFFYENHAAVSPPLEVTPNGTHGYYYITGERSTFSRSQQLSIDYDLQLSATIASEPGYARIWSDPSDPSYLWTPGLYPATNIVGTFVSASFERITPVPEPRTSLLVAVGSIAMLLWLRLRKKARRDSLA